MINIRNSILNQEINENTPLAILTVGQFNKHCGYPQIKVIESIKTEKKYVYGMAGIAKLFNCSLPTANRIKASGKLDKAISQIGKKIIVDSDLALLLAGAKNGGRK